MGPCPGHLSLPFVSLPPPACTEKTVNKELKESSRAEVNCSKGTWRPILSPQQPQRQRTEGRGVRCLVLLTAPAAQLPSVPGVRPPLSPLPRSGCAGQSRSTTARVSVTGPALPTWSSRSATDCTPSVYPLLILDQHQLPPEQRKPQVQHLNNSSAELCLQGGSFIKQTGAPQKKMECNYT